MAIRYRAAAIAVLASLLAFTAPALAQLGTTSFTDDTFLDANWTIVTRSINGGGTVTANQVASGGTIGPYRSITNSVNSAAGSPDSNAVIGYHANAPAAFNPSASGMILSIDYSESSILLSPGVQTCGLALRQMGVIYYGPGFSTPAALSTWVSNSQTGLTETDFNAIIAGVHPDFSLAGKTIHFGFYRMSSTPAGAGATTVTAGIDDWNVVVHYDATGTAAQATSWGRIKQMYRGAP